VKSNHQPPSSSDEQVQFRLRDVRLPDPRQISLELNGDELLTGRVLDVTNDALLAQPCAVVAVAGLARPVIVPMNCLHEIG
jgi:hypothetical protein